MPTVTPLTAPTITLSGTLIAVDDDGNTTTSVTSGLTFQGDDVQSSGSNTYETEPVQVFNSNVNVAFSSSYTFNSLSAVTKPNGVVVYSENMNGDGNTGMTAAAARAKSAEIRYTLNGKDPSQTKSNIAKSNVTLQLNRNYSGDDNTILKARVYYQGQWSPVTTVKIRITDVNQSYTS